jgi:hypothetical protein
MDMFCLILIVSVFLCTLKCFDLLYDYKNCLAIVLFVDVLIIASVSN